MDRESEKITRSIKKKAAIIGKPLRFMELCGTHAETIAKYGIKALMPSNITLVSGPGCPVCVTDEKDVDSIVGLAMEGIPIAAYGDAISVPGNRGSLESARQKGAKVFPVYDVAEALEVRKNNPDLVFWAVGFETTAPMTAWAILNGIAVYSSHKLFPPAMEVLLKNKKIRVDGFINPGHVSAIIGVREYEKFKIPQVIAGFGALDVLLALDMLLSQIIKGKTEVGNEYVRLVKQEGNKKAKKMIRQVFEERDTDWRGLGKIKDSGLKIRSKYRKQDAEFIYKKLLDKIRKESKPQRSSCRCGEVLQGIIESEGCPLFKKVCTPGNPKGACMVSMEGACNVKYRFGE